jgi:hypothetical protein
MLSKRSDAIKAAMILFLPLPSLSVSGADFVCIR